MMKISGAFVYQPPTDDGLVPAGFMIALNLQNDDGTAVFPESGELPPNALWATVVLSYPQSPGVWVLDLTASTSGYGPVLANGVFPGPDFPPGGWMPAAISIEVNEWPEAIITAAAPAVPRDAAKS